MAGKRQAAQRSGGKSGLKSSAAIKNDNIKVIARFRPNDAARSCVRFGEDGRSVVITPTSGHDQIPFTYDRVFGEDAQQKQIFDYSIVQTTDDLAKGYNGTVLCYGETGAGKSYTVMGDLDKPETRGLIPRIFERIFEIIEESPKTIEYTVGVSYLEIYNELLRDLLDPRNNKHLAIRENRVDGVYVSHLETFYVANLNDVYTILREGSLNRTTSATRMNDQSSRSHAIFRIKLSSKNLETGIVKMGDLSLVDLAGSEKIDKTGASGQLLEEAKKINSSLSALGNVINHLTDGKSHHIPYRDSKLTRILQESLGGNSRTTLIINCSPSPTNAMETLSTLRFGSRAKHITNAVHINSELSMSELKKRYYDETAKNERNAKRLATMQDRINTLEEENKALKERLRKYTDDSATDESISSAQLKEELKGIALSGGSSDLSNLSKALENFGSQLDNVGIQNVKLKKTISSLKKMSEMKDSRISELQQQLGSREMLVSVNSENFKKKVGYLRSRLDAVKATSGMNKSEELEKENAPSDTESAKLSKRIGLDLRIVKPMRGQMNE